MLAKLNFHPRDAFVSFEEERHLYTFQGIEKHPISVTTLIHKFFEKFDADKIIAGMMKKKNWPMSKYYVLTPEEIKQQWSDNGKKQSGLGTDMHKAIEDYINDDCPYKQTKINVIPIPTIEECSAERAVECKIPTLEQQTKYNIPILPPVAFQTKEFEFFLTFWRELTIIYPGIKPYRTEWTVYDIEKMISGNIDLILIDENANLIIIDWKRSKEIKMEGFKDSKGNTKKGLGIFSHLDDCNYVHYSLQLNIYRHLLETHYDKRVVDMYLAIFHPINDKRILIPVKRMEKEITDLWNLLPINNEGH
jgi:ATP-dependent exoDNAse (exonuclease V) beta subunit